ncbi:deoxyribose-phosphate aldolase, partial [Actinomadura kijaniata]|uniref:deoxyribose-phosphate aldolase n=1 Tax=Actinomadura kijaniata TaxID=46161 RepID=UPI003F1D83A6
GTAREGDPGELPADRRAEGRRLPGGPDHGGVTTRTKVGETAELVGLGAQEIDMVVDIGRLRAGDAAFVRDEIAAVVRAARGRPVKVILENFLLTDGQKVAGCRAAEAAGAAFVKTSTGFAAGGATPADIALMRQAVSPAVQVKAAGGVRTLDALLRLHRLGATRFGATATAAILGELERRHDGEAPLAGAAETDPAGY